MSKAEPATPATESINPTTDLADGANIDKIRDILFGAQSRDLEKRLNRLEERIAQESLATREELRKRIEALETYTRSEIDALSTRLRSEQAERNEAIDGLVDDLKSSHKALERRIAQVDELVATSQRDLRQQILDQSNTLSDDIKRHYELLSAALERQVRELRTEKTDRESLADLFTEMAVRLKDDFRLPNANGGNDA